MKRLSLHKELERAGYVFLEKFGSGLATEELLCLVGEPVALGGGSVVHRLSPKTAEEAPYNTYSGAYGLGTFPLHSDLAHWHAPPRYFLLRCIVGFEAVPTVVVDGANLVTQAGAAVLARALMQPRRPLNGRRPLLRLYEASTGLLRWDERYIVPATASGVIGARALQETLERATPDKLSLGQPGDTLVIDNWRMLHGRAPVPGECKTRIIERVYLRSVHS